MQVLGELIKSGSELLTGVSDSAQLDVELIVMSVCKLERYQLVTGRDRELDEDSCLKIETMIKRRLMGEPIAYIIGEKHFMGLKFAVTSGVLIPRPDTEVLVETILEDYEGKTFSGVEIGSGSGAICISLLSYSKESRMTALDISEIAIEITSQNAYSNEVKNRLTVLYSDVFSALDKDAKYDFVVSNPPYIRRSDIEGLMNDVKDFEPHLALDGGLDGLDFYRQITEESPGYLKCGGGLYFEIGYDQGKDVSELLEARGFCEVRIIKDLAGHDRVVCGKWKE
ncbi:MULTISPECIES: peptide chain release factor N(5)-glutamine methyltransferase [unclassified Fusibacter]|uniref:peptide chain release factor N(5)-glutamine methyltransferase n=1 Tax=unclassified Fusibacter TaxID=2624464 RepID=UPI00101309AA|nr:peptide chain release factor N(5)-glutamine methyltransferase [Fusibacter sp. A1]MCK8059878.1 peptide chain release factor N(5)-glutamine methyltransferase [Fusibacter sp. A2]NPE21680.1 peptide chain release factor N(5)-glutamine methyltransferase [Fusibacter sp. A1]RXV62083.1 peptide chain release factor N(5)-glutamine methyltransferase [Fusibacter sp. A1]